MIVDTDNADAYSAVYEPMTIKSFDYIGKLAITKVKLIAVMKIWQETVIGLWAGSAVNTGKLGAESADDVINRRYAEFASTGKKADNSSDGSFYA